MTNRTLLRLGLRLRRTSLLEKTKLADSASRRGAFSASMQQFEELLTASTALGPASRPITLYYATVQAGYAIAATHHPDPWSFSQHGLKLTESTPSIADARIEPKGVGAFQIVTAATGSPLLDGSVTVGALWTSLPDLAEVSLGNFRAVRALGVSERLPRQSFRYTIVDGVMADEVIERDETLGLELIVEDDCPGQRNVESYLRELLPSYPGVEGFTVVADSYSEIREGRWTVELHWDRSLDLDVVAPCYRHVGYRYLRPCLDDKGNYPPSPLMTWWALLYAFSMFSRYHPREWGKLLDIDKSGAAAKLEYCLDLALEVIPHLVAEALDGQPLLLTRPLEL